MRDLVERYGTPLYVYRLPHIRAASRDLRKTLPSGTALSYAVGANPHPRLVAELVRGGLGCEVSSPGELNVALAVGLSPEECVYEGCGMSGEEAQLALRSGVRRFRVDSPAGYRRLWAAAATSGVKLEYLISFSGAGPSAACGPGGGLPPDSLHAFPALFRGTDLLDPVGLHVVPPRNVSRPALLIDALEASVRLAAGMLREARLRPRVVGIGDGFAAPFARPGRRPAYGGLGAALRAVLDAHLPGWRSGDPSVSFASGPHLVADSGVLLTRVLDVRRGPAGDCVVLDAGRNVLGGPPGADRAAWFRVQPRRAAGGHGRPIERFVLVGPLCGPADVLNRSAALPRPRVGDVLEIPNAGAFGLTTGAVAFAGRPCPAEVVLDEGGAVVSARRLETQARELAR
ncbi:hypothetical protein [Streptomyces sp. MP131-18]|uniref:hypothetical protein n=1 Tax=Streptomyces sp. MP131-18 TaxID=1857892 RepID=UPI00097C5094|nr:hypothetical protein [Streptomyces sp. MP131-18]ONK15801.1 Diaminopimelate decarboxylase [Streptomyces sp. MP131-18]